MAKFHKPPFIPLELKSDHNGAQKSQWERSEREIVHTFALGAAIWPTLEAYLRRNYGPISILKTGNLPNFFDSDFFER